MSRRKWNNRNDGDADLFPNLPHNEEKPKANWSIVTEPLPSSEEALRYAVSGTKLLIEKCLEDGDKVNLLKSLDLYYKYLKLDNVVIDKKDDSSEIVIRL